MKRNADTLWDVVIIGGGAAGMMAAATAASRGATVCLLEKNASLGKKLRITGGGRCNVTNNKPNDRDMLDMYRGNGKYLFSTFAQHGVGDTVSWFESRGVALKEENEGRMFPQTDSADTICDTLIAELKKTGVTIVTNAVTTRIEKQSSDMFSITTQGASYRAKHCVVATGGISRPETGSTGDGFVYAENLGHRVKTNDVALVPLVTKESWVREVSGISLDKVKLTFFLDGERVLRETGKLLFTHKGVSGPTILNLSKQVGELLQSGTVTLQLDLAPTSDVGTLRSRLTALLQEHSNKKVRNVISELVPTAVGKIVLRLAEVADDTPCHSVRVEEKKRIVDVLKTMPLTIAGLMGKDKAVISSGGVHLDEIDFKTMQSKVVPGLFFVGDMLDMDRPSGGYSLQLCWSTGYVAGVHAAIKG